MARTDKPSKVENAKQASHQLRGTVSEVLASDATSFEHDDVQVLKFHGIYQQQNRDDKAAGEKQTTFMIRTRLPGGRLTAQQYLQLDDLAGRVTYNNSLRVTTRQAFQLHGIIKSQLKQTMAEMNKALVTTIAACGDVARNVMASPAPFAHPVNQRVQELAETISDELAPATGAYYEIWLDGEKAQRHENEVEEPFYGEVYLPRKFKVGITLPDDNSIDVYTQDCGLIAIPDGDTIKAVNVLAGGGLGMTHRKADTFARLGSQVGSVAVEHAAEAVKVVAGIFRDHGNRSDRRHARLKYLIEEWGIERFREEFIKRADFPVGDWIDVGPMELNDYLGAQEQGDGRYFYGIWIENGRIIDREDLRLKTALRTVAQRLDKPFILTPNQSITVADLTSDDVQTLEAILSEHGVTPADKLSGVRRYAMACVALPTCGLALAESERYLPDLIEQLESELSQYGLEDEPFTVRMTGCPNGCARPYTADLAFVGRKPGVYDIFMGGRLAGDRVAELFAESVADEQLIPTLRPVFQRWARDRQPAESLGDFYNRRFAREKVRTLVTGSKEYQGRVTLEGMSIDN
jgi:sulfite reductase (ferredoxin)